MNTHYTYLRTDLNIKELEHILNNDQLHKQCL